MLTFRLAYGLKGIVTFAALACMMSAASLTLLDSGDGGGETAFLGLRYRIIGGSLLAMLLINAGRLANLVRWPNNSRILVFWTLLAASWLMSAIFHMAAADIVSGLWLLVGVPCVFFAMLPSVHGNLMPLALKAYIVSQMPYVVMSLVEHPIHVSYRGVFANPNSMGTVAASMAACMLCILHSQIVQRAPFSRLVPVVVVTSLLIALTLLSGSRTSLFALVAAFGVVLCALASVSSHRRRALTVAVLLASPLLFVAADIGGKSVWSHAYEKYALRDDALSGRGRIGATVFADAALMGHGSHYFTERVGLGAHNSLFEALGKYGLIAAMGLAGIAVTSILDGYRYNVRRLRHDPYAMAPVVVCVAFWVLSMGEGMFGAIGRGVTILLFVSIGVIAGSGRKKSSCRTSWYFGQIAFPRASATPVPRASFLARRL